MFDFINAVITLATTGDFQGWMAPILGQEDSALVDIILSSVGK